jgi:coiled-coil domain-containing protein 77
LEAIHQIRVTHEEQHQLAWELHQRLNEIADLQKSVSDAQTSVFEERKQLLKLIAENDELKSKNRVQLIRAHWHFLIDIRRQSKN